MNFYSKLNTYRSPVTSTPREFFFGVCNNKKLGNIMRNAFVMALCGAHVAIWYDYDLYVQGAILRMQ